MLKDETLQEDNEETKAWYQEMLKNETLQEHNLKKQKRDIKRC